MAEHICPVWMGYLLASPIRKLLQNPETILSPYIENGMKVLDIGCGMGFFSLPLAQSVGSTGKVICIDVQEKMIRALEKRTRKAGLFDRIETRKCDSESFGLDGLEEQIDFALAFAVVHEVSDASFLFSEIYNAMKPARRFLVAEPKVHVSEKELERVVSTARKNGFKAVDRPHIPLSLAVLLEK